MLAPLARCPHSIMLEARPPSAPARALDTQAASCFLALNQPEQMKRAQRAAGRKPLERPRQHSSAQLSSHEGAAPATSTPPEEPCERSGSEPRSQQPPPPDSARGKAGAEAGTTPRDSHSPHRKRPRPPIRLPPLPALPALPWMPFALVACAIITSYASRGGFKSGPGRQTPLALASRAVSSGPGRTLLERGLRAARRGARLDLAAGT